MHLAVVKANAVNVIEAGLAPIVTFLYVLIVYMELVLQMEFVFVMTTGKDLSVIDVRMLY